MPNVTLTGCLIAIAIGAAIGLLLPIVCNMIGNAITTTVLRIAHKHRGDR